MCSLAAYFQHQNSPEAVMLQYPQCQNTNLDKQKKEEKVKVIKLREIKKLLWGTLFFPLTFPHPPNKDWRREKLLY